MRSAFIVTQPCVSLGRGAALGWLVGPERDVNGSDLAHFPSARAAPA